MTAAASAFETIAIDAKAYLSLKGKPKHIEEQLSIVLSSHSYLPCIDDLTSDWVAHVAVPAFKLIRSQRGRPVDSFCSIGTGSGLDVLAAIETLGATHVSLTDIHEDVVTTAVNNVLRNNHPSHPLTIESGFGDLFDPLRPYHSKYELIYENLPNVPIADAQEVNQARTSSAYVAPRKESIPSLIKQQMLDLHYLALLQAKDFLLPNGAILSILGSRVPLKVFLSLGSLAGHASSFQLFTWKVQADPEDIIRNHAGKQKEGFGPFYFYHAETLRKVFATIDPQTSGEHALDIEQLLWPERLDAVAAYQALKDGATIGHTVAVLRSERK